MRVPGLIAGLVMVAQGADAETSREIYVSECIAAVSEVSDFTCADGAVVPISVNGIPVTAETFETGMSCDRPSLLDNGPGSDGQCVPGSRILDLSSETMQVSAMCRMKHNRADMPLMFDEIDVIVHNPVSGATCWFQASAPSKDAPIDGTSIASPTRVTAQGFWKSPEDVAQDGCGTCHDNDPFMYSPFAGQVWEEVPTNPFGPYWHVGGAFGFDDWPSEVFDLRDNTCVGCHRIGPMETSGDLTDWMTGHTIAPGADGRAEHFPLSHGMPPEHDLTMSGWITFHGSSVAQIRSCHADPTQQFCNLTSLRGYTP